MEKKIKILKRSQLLNLIIKDYSKSIAVSGSHGKTTATSMLAHIMICARCDPTVFLGGEDREFSNLRIGKGSTALFEACEYKKNILDYDCSFAVVLNVDNDHVDSYKNLEEQILTFKKFTKGKKSLINGDDVNSKRLMTKNCYTFGLDKKNDFSAQEVKTTKNGVCFKAYFRDSFIGEINLKIHGKHNVYNALSAIAVSLINGIEFSHVKNALENFTPVSRRNQVIGKYNGLKLVCDYAHHPKEITKMIEQYDDEYKDYLLVFQPHTYSRTKVLINDFIKALNIKNSLILYKTYPAREKYQLNGSAKTLYEKIKRLKGNCFYAKSVDGLLREIEKESNGKKAIIFLGAGDIIDVAKKISKKGEKYQKIIAKNSQMS